VACAPACAQLRDAVRAQQSSTLKPETPPTLPHSHPAPPVLILVLNPEVDPPNAPPGCACAPACAQLRDAVQAQQMWMRVAGDYKMLIDRKRERANL
jgi:hypothetical protein